MHSSGLISLFCVWTGQDQEGCRSRQGLPHFGHIAIFQESHLDIVGIDIVRSRDIWVPSLEDDSGVINWGCSERANKTMRYSVPSHTKLLRRPMSPRSSCPEHVACPIFSPLPLCGQTNFTLSSHLSTPDGPSEANESDATLPASFKGMKSL